MLSPESVAMSVVHVPQETHGPLADRFLAREMLPCWIGLSPSTSSVNRARLQAIVEWASKRSRDMVIVEGSFAERWNLMSEEGLSESAAIAQVRAPVDRFRRRVSEVQASLDAETSVRVFDWEEALASTAFKSIHGAITAYASGSALFSEAAIYATQTFLQRRGITDSRDLADRQQDTWAKYLFEELAVFLLLYSEGYRVEVYPGADLPLMQSIAAGCFPEFPVRCADRTHIGIRVDTQ